MSVAEDTSGTSRPDRLTKRRPGSASGGPPVVDPPSGARRRRRTRTGVHFGHRIPVHGGNGAGMAADAVALDRLASFRRGALPRLRIHPIQKDRFSILVTGG